MEDPGLTPRPDEATPEEDEDAGATAPEPETMPEEPDVTDPDEQRPIRDA
jgi:hypothetical protein